MPVVYAVAFAFGAALVLALAVLAVLAVLLVLGLTAVAAVVGAAATAAFTVVFVVAAICRAWVAVLRDDEHGHLMAAPPDPLPPGRDPGYASYVFGPAWRDYALATTRGAAQACDRTVRRGRQTSRSVLDILGGIWRFPDGFEAWTGVVGKIVFGGAVFGGLLGLAAGGLVAAAFLGITTATFALLLAAVIGPMLLLTAALRVVELAGLRLRGITVECPSCHRRVGVPVYECPSCQDLHRTLVPGPLGVLVRTCRCREELPTLLVRGRSRLRSHCSHDDCRGVLPLGGLTVPTRHVPLVAGKVAGKTVHVMAAIADLRAHSNGTGPEFGDEHTRTTFEQVEKQLEDVAAVPSTLPTAPLRAATFFHGTGSARRLVYLYDAAGERYQTSDDVAGLRFLGATAGVLFVIDPLAFDPVRTRMEESDVVLPMHSTELPDGVVGRFTAGLREHGGRSSADRIPVPVAVVLTKCDVLVDGGPVRHPYDDLGEGDDCRAARSAAVERWLETTAGEGGLVRQLHTDYERIGYFAVSALDVFGTTDRTSTRTGRAVGNDAPSAPLRWLLGTEGT